MEKALAHVNYHEPEADVVYSKARTGPTRFSAASNGHWLRGLDIMAADSLTTAARANHHVALSNFHTTHQIFPGRSDPVDINGPAAHETVSNSHRVMTETASAMALHELPAMPGFGVLPALFRGTFTHNPETGLWSNASSTKSPASQTPVLVPPIYTPNMPGFGAPPAPPRDTLAHILEARLKGLWVNASTTESPTFQTLVSVPPAHTPNESNSILNSPSTATTDWALEAIGSPDPSTFELEFEEGADEVNGHNLWFQWNSGPLAGIEIIGNNPNIAIGQSSPTPPSLKLNQMTAHCRSEPTFKPWEDLACPAEEKINSWTLALGRGMKH